MICELNSPNEIKKRKYQDALKLCGNGMIIFSIWSLAKAMIEIFTGNIVGAGLEDFSSQHIIVKIFAIIVVLIFMSIEIMMRVYIWKNAVRESRGEQGKKKHLVLAFIILVTESFLMVYAIVLKAPTGFTIAYIMEVIIEITDAAITVCLMIYTFKLRKIITTIEAEA